MPRYKSAWVTITAKVFVDTRDIAEKMGLENTEDETPMDQVESISKDKIAPVFEELARQQIMDEYFSSDHPCKHYETEIDLSTLK